MEVVVSDIPNQLSIHPQKQTEATNLITIVDHRIIYNMLTEESSV